MNTLSKLLARIFVRSLTMPMPPQNGKESESVHGKGVRMSLVVSPLVWWGGGMSLVSLSGAAEAHSYRKTPHFGFQWGNFGRFWGQIGLISQ